MEFQHSCSFCGWRRSSSTPVMLSPSCVHCGCALDATAAPHDVTPVRAALSVPPRVRLALRALGALCCALVLFAGARLGYRLAGPSGALIAFGVAGFLLLPFVPERLGAPGRSRHY
jgi:hypothetical protein